MLSDYKLFRKLYGGVWLYAFHCWHKIPVNYNNPVTELLESWRIEDNRWLK